MKTIIVRSQAEWNALPAKFDEYTRIEIRSPQHEGIAIYVVPGSSHVEAWESSHVEAWESSHVVAWESSHVEAWESSHVVAWESSHVVARGSSHVVARGSSHVEARGSSHVVAWGQSAIHQKSSNSPELHGQAACFLYDGYAAPIRKSDTAGIIQVVPVKDNAGWLEAEGVTESDGAVVLYKRISKDWLTQEGAPNQTTWVIGEVKTHPAWNPTESECGAGKFHACSRPYFCDEFRETPGDRYIAIQVKVSDDLHAWPGATYPHKIAFRECVVLYECDRYGKQVKASEVRELYT